MLEGKISISCCNVSLLCQLQMIQKMFTLVAWYDVTPVAFFRQKRFRKDVWPAWWMGGADLSVHGSDLLPQPVHQAVPVGQAHRASPARTYTGCSIENFVIFFKFSLILVRPLTLLLFPRGRGGGDREPKLLYRVGAASCYPGSSVPEPKECLLMHFTAHLIKFKPSFIVILLYSAR